MPADRLLSTLLRALLEFSPEQETPRILGTAASLLTSLNNHLNVTLLVQHVSKSPALWTAPDGLRFCLSYMGIFHSATQRIVQRDRTDLERSLKPLPIFPGSEEPHVALSKWAVAVLEGLDEHSPRSRHVLALGGILNGLSRQDEDVVSPALRAKLQEAFVKATNLALSSQQETELGRLAVVLALNYTFPRLSKFEQSRLNYNELLPLMTHTLLHSGEGLESGQFLQPINTDLQQVSNSTINWPTTSRSYVNLQAILSKPLIVSMGPLSKLIAHAAESTRDPTQVSAMVDEVAELSRHIFAVWRSCQLSSIDVIEEERRLHQEARTKTLPELWKLLRSSLFALTIMLRSAIGRMLADGALSSDLIAPQMALQCLSSLRDLNFIFARLSSSAFSQHTFVHLACIDILNSYPATALTLLKTISPSTIGTIPQHPLDRVADLYFLNTAEHFTLITPPQEAESLLIASARPYLTSTPTPELLPSFEAAHSVMLAVFSAPQNAEITARQLPSYVDALFRAFPQNLSARQFRLAFKNLVRITSPPVPMSRQQPFLAAILLDLVRERAQHASPSPLPASVVAMADEPPQPMSEQVVMVLTLLDALPFVALDLLEEWLPLLPEMIHQVPDRGMRELCVRHLWEVLVGGSMDPDRSHICVAWWTTGGGSWAVLQGSEPQSQYMMTGALQGDGSAKL